MEHAPPFRTTLRSTPEPDAEHRRLFFELAGLGDEASQQRGHRDLGLWEQAVARKAEDLSLLVLPRLAKQQPKTEGEKRQHEMLLRQILAQAVSAADGEGVAWTPLLDALALVSNRIRTNAVVRGEIEPPLVERAERLAPWVAAQREPRVLEEFLSTFSSSEAHRTVARHTRLFHPGLVGVLQGAHGHALVRNPHAPAELKRSLLEWAWSQWQVRCSHLPSTERTLLQDWLRREGGFPDDLRGRMIQVAREKGGERATSGEATEVWLMLLADSSLEAALIQKVVEEESSSRVLARALLHPAAGALSRRLLAHPPAERQNAFWETARELLAHLGGPYSLSEEMLWSALTCYMSRDANDRSVQGEVVGRALLRPEATPAMWKWALAQFPAKSAPQARLLDSLKEAPGIWDRPGFLQALIDTEETAFLTRLIPTEHASAYQEILVALWGISHDAVYRVLRQKPIPEGVVLPLSMRRELLQARSSEDRLAAISAMSRLSESGREEDEEVAEGSLLARFTSRLGRIRRRS